jgi:hypothetical protein
MRSCLQAMVGLQQIHSITLCGFRVLRLYALFDVIQQSPSVSLLVQELRLEFMDRFRLNDLDLPADSPEPTQILSCLLRSFTRLCKLELNSFWWEWVGSDIKQSILDALALPSLVDLDVQLVFFPTPGFFTNLFCSHLE